MRWVVDAVVMAMMMVTVIVIVVIVIVVVVVGHTALFAHILADCGATPSRMEEFCAARTPRARRRRRLSSSTMRIPCRLVLLLLATAATIARGDGLDGERFVPSVGAEGTFVDEH